MNQLHAVFQWLVDSFNALWPMLLAAFAGATAATRYQLARENRACAQRRVDEVKSLLAALRVQLVTLARAESDVLTPWREARRRTQSITPGWRIPLLPLETAGWVTLFGEDQDLCADLFGWRQRMAEIGALCDRRLELDGFLVEQSGAARGRQRQRTGRKSLNIPHGTTGGRRGGCASRG